MPAAGGSSVGESLLRGRCTPRRQLGRTGFAVTVLGIRDVADRSVPLQDCVRTVRRALEAGLNVVDTAPRYEDGCSARASRWAIPRGTAERMRQIRERARKAVQGKGDCGWKPPAA